MTNPQSALVRRQAIGTSNKFLYRSVMDELRSRITAGKYERGARIPSVEELAQEFGVSTITVRRAIRDLSLAGVLVGRQGLGVFVAEEKRIIRSIGTDGLEPIEENMRLGGVTASLQHLGITLMPLPEEPFLAPLAASGAHLYRLERLLLADGKAVGLDTVWLPRKLANKLKDHLHGEFIISQLGRYGIAVDHIKYQIEATTASEAQAFVLNVVTGFPLLVIRFFPTGPDGRILLVGRNVTRADRFTYELIARPFGNVAVSRGRRRAQS